MLRAGNLIILLLGLLLPASLFALDLPPVPKGYVSDYAGLLTAAQKQAFNKELMQYETDTSNQVLVATFPDLEGETIAEVSIRLAELWKPGQSGRDNGVLLVVAPKERKVRIEVGYGLEGALPDATSKSIIEGEILPSFKKGDFPEGIRRGLQGIFAATRGEYAPNGATGSSDQGMRWVGFFIALFLMILFATLARRLQSAVGYSGAGGWTGGYIPSGRRSGGFSGGLGGGGFSGGGGSFGGGGASGSW